MNAFIEEDEQDDFAEEPDVVSKSQKKREIHALLNMVEQALQLSDEKLSRTGLDEKILNAFTEVRRIKASGARNRQLKYITKLLTHQDSSTLENFLREADEKKVHENHPRNRRAGRRVHPEGKRGRLYPAIRGEYGR